MEPELPPGSSHGGLDGLDYDEAQLLENINDGLQSKIVVDMFSEWEEEKVLLLTGLSKLWNSPLRTKFQAFWNDEAQEDQHHAMLATAFEETSTGTFGEMIPVTCPELHSIDHIISTKSSFPQLIELVSSCRENLNLQIPDEHTKHISDPNLARKSIKLARSCTLLLFCWSILEIFRAQSEANEMK